MKLADKHFFFSSREKKYRINNIYLVGFSDLSCGCYKFILDINYI